MIRFCILVTVAVLPLSGQRVDEIVDRAVAARGGAAKIRAIKTQRLSGRISFASDSPNAFSVEIRRGGSIREEFVAAGAKLIRVSDGKTGWVRVGQDAPVPIQAADLKSLAGSADIDGLLIDYKEKGTQIAYAGIVEIEGQKNYKLVITPKDGPGRTDYIDTRTYFETKWEGTISANGKELQVESFFRDYRDVDGIKIAFHIDSNTLGTNINQKIVFDRIEINPQIDDERFTTP